MFWFQTVEFQLMLTEMNDDVNQSFSWQRSRMLSVFHCMIGYYVFEVSIHSVVMGF
jgi:hypothetical protein